MLWGSNMRRTVIRNLVFVGIVLLLIGTSLIAIHIGVHADSNQRLVLHSNRVALLQRAQLVQATNPQQQLHLSISLRLRNQTGLDNLLAAIYDPQSAQYHQYLTPDEYNQLFAPAPDQVQQIVAFLQSRGITITNTAPNNLLIDATATVGQVQQTFNTRINNYKLAGHTFYANATPPSIPAPLSQLITSIGGLDNSVQYQPLYHRLNTGTASCTAPTGCSKNVVAPRGGVVSATPSGYNPKDLSRAYDATPLQESGILGDNQTIAHLELDGYQASDVAQYFQTYNLGTPSITNVLVDGFNGAAGQGAIEPEMDIEVAAALAPHARQIVYEGPNTTQGLNDTYNRIVTDHKAQIATTSWGLCEANSGPGELQTLDSIFKQAAAQGISFFAASGDSGAYDCGDGNAAVDSPASDPYVTAVGGTSLQLIAGVYGHESVWSNANAILRSPNGAGSGGGVSNTFKQPAWQSGPGVLNQYSNGYRQVPDVAGNADFATGYAVYCTVTNAGCNSSGWITTGGTSAASPLWAGSMALVNQYLKLHGKARIGFANPALYQLFKHVGVSLAGTSGLVPDLFPAFHDIIDGSNLLYSATVGYDLASGLGSPDIYNIARDLAGIPAGTTATSPSALLQNSDFESGQGSWQESSASGYELIDTFNPHSGQYSADFCGYVGCDDSLSQSFTVPASYTTITISYWWYADTSQTARQCLDIFASRLKTSSGALIHTLQRACNNNLPHGWVQESFDVSGDLANYTGQQVMLFFHAYGALGHNQFSDFYVDDVAISVQ